MPDRRPALLLDGTINNVTRFRLQLGLTTYALSKRVGVAVSTIRRIETGRIKKPHPLTKLEIANALNSTVDKVFPDVDA